jgi:excisionase family DNA binding protein
MITPRLLTAEDVADLLRVSVDTVYDYARDGLLPSVRFGRSVRFKSEDVDAFIAAASERPRFVKKGARHAR